MCVCVSMSRQRFLLTLHRLQPRFIAITLSDWKSLEVIDKDHRFHGVHVPGQDAELCGCGHRQHHTHGGHAVHRLQVVAPLVPRLP